jgi:multidrug efflux pump subunit AcrA (membrane-fusion protein)
MRVKGLSRGFALSLVWAGLACGQTVPTAARIEAIPLELTMPERYQVAEVLEPIRRVTLIAPADGMIRSMEVRLGGMVRESQEVAQLDRTEASARLKMARAELKEKQAQANSTKPVSEVNEAQLEAALARVELAQLQLDRCTLHAPFTGRVSALPVCSGQYVMKGAAIAELADVTSFKTLQPVDRRSVAAGSSLTVQIEGREVSGKVQAVLPLPATFTTLRELATPFAAALVVVANTKGEFEPGLRVQSSSIPTAPIATIPKRAFKSEDGRGSEAVMIQVIRNEYVANVSVRVLGDTGPDRVQISAALRASDALIVSSSVPLLPGTLVRFGDGATNRAADGTPAGALTGGAEAGITSPSVPRGRPGTGSSTPPRSNAPSQRPPTRPASSGAAPF